eukprot:225033-Rhodomonas_salina.8
MSSTRCVACRPVIGAIVTVITNNLVSHCHEHEHEHEHDHAVLLGSRATRRSCCKSSTTTTSASAPGTTSAASRCKTLNQATKARSLRTVCTENAIS